jgi:para-aminobenzoate synthetase component 1
MMREAAIAKEKQDICKIHWQRIRLPVSIAAVSETFSQVRGASILGGHAASRWGNGFSYWAAAPQTVFEFQSGQNLPFEKLERALGRYRLAEDSPARSGAPPLPPGMFCGGWIGYFSYELGRHIETLPATTTDDLGIPLIRLCFHDRVIAHDGRDDTFWIVVLEIPNDSESPGEKIAALERLLLQAQAVTVASVPRGDIERFDFSDAACNMTKEQYLAAVARIKHYIRDGDVYQVNFARRLRQRFLNRPIRLLHWQNRYNPSGYSAYLDAGSFHLVSVSPEMFLTIQDGTIHTRPIKGTRPRVGAEHPNAGEINRTNREELLTSSKEQAELNMIVDLERNDLARICVPGTRRVVQPRTIEAHPTVFHAAATVGGTLRNNVTLSDVLRATFPGGSITGAPKIRAMEIIDTLEPTARDVYTGSIGFIGIDGTVNLNIAIRTIIITDHDAFVHAGGGIVADSDPEAEWEETVTKARALLAGIRAIENS